MVHPLIRGLWFSTSSSFGWRFARFDFAASLKLLAVSGRYPPYPGTNGSFSTAHPPLMSTFRCRMSDRGAKGAAWFNPKPYPWYPFEMDESTTPVPMRFPVRRFGAWPSPMACAVVRHVPRYSWWFEVVVVPVVFNASCVCLTPGSYARPSLELWPARCWPASAPARDRAPAARDALRP